MENARDRSEHEIAIALNSIALAGIIRHMKQLESFFWGAIAALGALVIQLVILLAAAAVQNPYGQALSVAYVTTAWGIVGAAFIEEFFKYIIIVKRIEYLSLEKTFIVNSLFVGLGFFSVELALIYLKHIDPAQHIWALGEIGIIHLATAGIIGYRIATRNPKKMYTFVSTLLLVTAIHSAYNLLINYHNPLTEPLIFALLGLLILATCFAFFRISAKLKKMRYILDTPMIR